MAGVIFLGQRHTPTMKFAKIAKIETTVGILQSIIRNKIVRQAILDSFLSQKGVKK